MYVAIDAPRPDAVIDTGGVPNFPPLDAVAPADAAVLDPYEVVRLDPVRSEFPEALTVRGGNAYVALPTLGRVLEVTPEGRYRAYVEVPLGSETPRPTLRGLVFDATGRLIVAVSGAAGSTRAGLWRVPAGGGIAEMFAHDPGLTSPSGLDIDDGGNVWVTDSAQGAIWKVSSDGRTLARWSNDAALQGGAPPCGPVGSARTGANSLVVDLTRHAVYASNTDRSSVVRIAVQPDGSAGAVTTFSVRDCQHLRGAWGLAAWPNGSLLVTAGLVNQVSRIALDGTVTTVAAPPGLLRTPAGIGYDPVAQMVWVANSALVDATTMGGMARPGVVRIPLTR